MPFITQGKTNWKYILILVVLVAVVGGVTLWCSTKQEFTYQPPEIQEPEKVDETADWQTYRNENFGFEIKYPLLLEGGESGCRISEIEDTIFIGPVSLIFFDIRGLTLDEWIHGEIAKAEEDTKEMQERFRRAGYENWQEFGSKLLSREEIFIGGERAIKLSYQFIGAGFDLPITISIKKGDRIYDFRTNDANLVQEGCAAKFGKKPSEFMELMLSTFRFVETELEQQLPGAEGPKKVVGRTNKNIYYQHVDLDAIEYIEVTLENNLQESIFSSETNIEKKTQDGDWEKLPRDNCVLRNCYIETRLPIEIKPGESKTVDGISVDVIEPGTYRFELIYYLEGDALEQDHFHEPIFSNEFTVYPELVRAKFTEGFSEETIDTNNNGLYDFLVIQAEVSVTIPGKYYIHGYLVGNGIGFYAKSPLLMFEEGLHLIPLKFDGQSIRYGGADGPYYLQNLYLETEDKNTTDMIFLELRDEKGYRTKPYLSADFEPSFND